MKRVYLASALPEERADLRALLINLGMQIVGESAGLRNVLAMAPATHPEVLVISWGLMAARSVAALKELHSACPMAVVIISPGREQMHLSPKASGEASEADNLSPMLSLQASRIQAALASVQSI